MAHRLLMLITIISKFYLNENDMKKNNFKQIFFLLSVNFLVLAQFASAAEPNVKTTSLIAPVPNAAQKKGQSVSVQVAKFYDILDIATAMPEKQPVTQKLARTPAQIKAIAPAVNKISQKR